MTPGELKFALLLESKLNSIPDPEYRQLVVEVLMVVGLVAKASSQPSFGHTPILVDRLINLGLQLFLQDQVHAASTPYIYCMCKVLVCVNACFFIINIQGHCVMLNDTLYYIITSGAQLLTLVMYSSLDPS